MLKQTVICTDIHGNKHEAPADQLQWRPSAYAIVIKDGKLLTPRHFGRHNLPGGGLELGEAPEMAVIRETKEETGIDVTKPRFVTAATQFFAWKNTADEKTFYQTILLYYVCDFVGGELSKDGFDQEEKEYAELAEWYPLHLLDKLATAGTHDWRPIVKRVADVR